MLDLSIIIPIYNTPREALQKCFSSVKALQDIRWEVLVVNDGSQEEISDFCKQYCAKNEDFIYFGKENGGVSSARNLGLEHARGRYIMFVDADDCLLPEPLTPTLLCSDADMVIFNMDVLQDGILSTWHSLESADDHVTQAAVLRRYLTSPVLNGPCGKLFKSSLIQRNDLRFNEDYITAEDWLFGCSFTLQAKDFRYIPESVYLYYRDGSTSLSRLQHFPDTMLENLIAMYHKKLQILETHFSAVPDLAQLQSAVSAMVVENLFNCAADLYLLKLQTPDRKARILEICRQACRYLLPSGPKKANIKAWILSYFWAGIYPLAHLRSLYLKRRK